MKKYKFSNTIKAALLSVALMISASCELEDHLQDPSQLSPSQAGADFIYNGLQLNLGNFFLNCTQFGMDNTRMLAMFGATYENAYTANTFNGVWYSAYSDFMINANLLLAKTTENPATTELEYNPFYQGTTKIMKAYVLMTLVDFFGDVPYSEALNAPNEYFPVADGGAAIYAQVKTLLSDGILDMWAVKSTTIKPTSEIYYAGSKTNWIRFAKTLQLKQMLQVRLLATETANSTTGIDALIAEDSMITASSGSQDFIFRFPANSVSNPNTYNPWFFNNYQTSTGQYMSNSYMKELFDNKGGVRDPRIRFYFYRQVTTPTTNVNELTCSSATSPPTHYPPGTAYCQLPNGYWGRDHLNAEGTPPDGLLKTTYGLYPAGGVFDASQAQGVDLQGNLNAGGGGKGILPMMMSSFTKFMIAEHYLILKSDPATAYTYLNNASREHIARVIAFDPLHTPTSGAILNTFNATAINNYMAQVTANYNSATPIAPNADLTQSKLDVIVKEYWVALWGNGIEAYNTVRRTGKPANLQPALAPNPGEFYRSFTYPAVYVIRNNNATQKPNNTVRVFWDTNPAGFIK